MMNTLRRMTHLEQFTPGAADSDIGQRLLALLGGAEQPEEAGQARLVIIPGEVKLGGLHLRGLVLDPS